MGYRAQKRSTGNSVYGAGGFAAWSIKPCKLYGVKGTDGGNRCHVVLIASTNKVIGTEAPKLLDEAYTTFSE